MKEHNCVTCRRLPVCSKVRRLVIADQDPRMIEEAEVILGKRRYLIVGKTVSSEETMKLCRERKPDMLLCGDFADGTEGRRIIRTVVTENPSIRCVLATDIDLSGKINDALKENLREDGVRAVTLKPFIREELLKVMDEVKFQES